MCLGESLYKWKAGFHLIQGWWLTLVKFLNNRKHKTRIHEANADQQIWRFFWKGHSLSESTSTYPILGLQETSSMLSDG